MSVLIGCSAYVAQEGGNEEEIHQEGIFLQVLAALSETEGSDVFQAKRDFQWPSKWRENHSQGLPAITLSVK